MVPILAYTSEDNDVTDLQMMADEWQTETADPEGGAEKWLGKIGQDDNWNFCLNSA